MFTGIIKENAIIERIEASKGNVHIWLESKLRNELTIDQSVAHNGICLTIDALEGSWYRITAIRETIDRTTISEWKIGDAINIELCLRLGDRLDGHIVQGHVDTTGICESIVENNGSYDIQFSFPSQYIPLVIEKGSICVDGISLTCHSLVDNRFSVSIIPYTWEHTNARYWSVGHRVNLEFDILGKYMLRQHFKT